MIIGIDHVLIAIPVGGMEVVRDYYGTMLGMTEVPRPAALLAREGGWFTAGSAALHIGAEEPFRPAMEAHPAFVVEDLDQLQSRLSAAGYVCIRSDGELPGIRRFHTNDPFGNRIEFQQA